MITAAFTLHRLLMRIGTSAGMLFAWVMFFAWELSVQLSLTVALSETAFAYALSQIVLILLLPLAGRLYARGIARVMMAAILALAGAYIALAGALTAAFEPLAALAAFAILAGAYRALYATPFALMHQDLHEDRYWFDIAVAYVPLLVGAVLAAGYAAESTILYAAAVFAVMSVIPLTRFEAYERYEWTYRETFGMLLEPAHRGYVWQGFVRGIEGAALFFAWPLFVYVILGQSYLALGLVFSVSAFLLLALRLAVPEKPIIETPLLAAAVVGSSWLARIVAIGPLPIIALQVLGTGAHERRIHEHVVHEALADGGTFLDELTTLKEVSLGFGRLFFALALAFMLQAFAPLWSLGFAFVLAAIAGAFAAYANHATR